MQGIKFKCLIATTGQYNGYNTYTTYFFAPSKQSYEEIIANDTSLTAWNKGLADITKKRADFMSENQTAGGYGQQGYGAPQQQQQQQQAQTMQAVNSMQSLQGVATQQPNTALDDDLPF